MTSEQAGLVCQIAENAETREQVYRLRYSCYFAQGCIDVRPDQQFSDQFDRTPNNFSFLVRNAIEEPLATVRISVVRRDLDWIEAPACHAFGDHPAFAKVARASFVEASRLCFGKSARRDIVIKLLGNVAAMADYYRVGWLVACPRMEHSHLYQRLFGFRPLAEPRPYFGVRFQSQMLGIRLETLWNYVSRAKFMQDAWSDAFAQLAQSCPLSATRTA